MICDWFKDSLRYYGHVRLDHFSCLRGCYRLGADTALRRLALREDMRHVVRFEGNTQRVQEAAIVKKTIEESEMPFQAPWTSFRGDDDLVFVFRALADAVRFRMMWCVGEDE